ncbi:MAG: acyl carrier protein [Planctomycetota bacterium]|nr:acyl carrier protein [Planctomycetota bacterium]MCZ6816002.1 acyl carrier protein [Planctomycetota bacterium]
MAMTRDEVYSKVKEVLVDALGVDDDEIKENATLIGDLGAESIDFLDIVFRLEKTFSIKIPKGELFPDDILQNPEFVDQGKMTAKGLAQLKEAMPHADFTEFEANPEVDAMPSLFTVKTIVNYVTHKTAA